MSVFRYYEAVAIVHKFLFLYFICRCVTKYLFFSVTMERYLQILNAKCATSVPTSFSVKVKRARIGHVRAVLHGGVSGLRHYH